MKKRTCFSVHKISEEARPFHATPPGVTSPVPPCRDSRQSDSTRPARRRARPLGVAEEGQENCVGVGMRLGRAVVKTSGLAGGARVFDENALLLGKTLEGVSHGVINALTKVLGQPL
jgi:hypothetical protein